MSSLRALWEVMLLNRLQDVPSTLPNDSAAQPASEGAARQDLWCRYEHRTCSKDSRW